jgi:tetratricopeptide (TPR) repeat protein
VAASLAAAAVFVYARTFAAGFIWDDDFYVWNNPTLKTLGGIFDIWFRPLSIPQYYPLVHTTYWLEYRLWGDHPAGYHVVNVLLHAGNAVLLWFVLRRLDVPAAWLGALLFAVHPVGVESVAWVTERKNTLSLCLALGSLLAWLEFRNEGTRPWRWYALSIALFAASLLAKTVTVSLIGVLLVLTWWKTGRITLRDLRLAAPYLAAGLPLAVATVWLEKHHVGAGNVDWGLSPFDRIVLAGRAVCFYASKLVWPHPLTFFYDRWQIDARQAWQWAFPAAVAAVLVGLVAVSGRIGRGPAAAAMLYCGLLFPALGFFDVYPFKFSYVADHFQYHAATAGLAALAGLAGWVMQRSSWSPGVLHATAIAVCGILAAVTLRQTGIYHDLETLCRDTLAKTPSSWAARNILGPYFTEAGRYADAEAVFSSPAARSHLPPWPHDLAMFRYNHAQALEGLGRGDEAEAAYREAIALDAAYLKPRNNLAKLLADTGRRGEAVVEYQALLALPLSAPDRARYAFNLGTVLADDREWRAAEEQFLEATRLSPDSGDYAEWLGIVTLRQGRVAEAVGLFERAVNLARDPAALARAEANLTAARNLLRQGS